MKKIVLLLGLVFMTSFLYACTNQKEDKNDANTQKEEAEKVTDTDSNEENVTKPEQTLTVKDYYPAKADTEYIYEGKGNEYASYNVYTDYIEGNRFQIRSNNGGSERVRVLEYQEGQLVELVSKGEIYYRENLTKVTNDNTEILLKEPFAKGTEWSLSDNRRRYISNVDVDITTPAGNFKALEVATESQYDTIYDYYAKGIGLVKSVFVSDDLEVSSSLSKIQEDVPFIQLVNFYFPDVDKNKIYYIARNLEFKTNDITKSIFEKTYKEFSQENYDKVLGPNVKINSMYLNKDNMVYVDFSKELLSEMNAGSGYEAMILQSITNTLGNYYGVQKVYITIEGEPYSSGHIAMNKGEPFEVNLENTVEFKQ